MRLKSSTTFSAIIRRSYVDRYHNPKYSYMRPITPTKTTPKPTTTITTPILNPISGATVMLKL